MAAYAPLFCKQGMTNWNSNLIWFDDRGLWRTPNYWYQWLFSNHTGDRAVPDRFATFDNADAAADVLTAASLDTRTGTGTAREFPDAPERPAVLLFTSGTSAEPKTAVLEHDQLLAYQFNTMEFASANDAVAKSVQPGTPITFEFVERKPGEWVVTKIQPATKVVR